MTTALPTSPPTPEAATARVRRRRRLLRLDDLRAAPPIEWLLPGFVHRSTVSLLTAQENSYKTFLALDLALSIVHGVPFHGRTVPSGDVVWLAGEGVSALRGRSAAWVQSHPDAERVGELIVPEGPSSFMDHRDVTDLLVQLAEDDIRPVLVVVDTVSTVVAGEDQNATGPMTRVVEQAQRFVDTCGATCLLVHHSPKERPTAVRGSGALQAGARSRMTMATHGRGRVRLTSEANNDAATGATLELRFLPVGESGVLVEADPAAVDAVDVAAAEGGPADEFRAQIEEALHEQGGNQTTKAHLQEATNRQKKRVASLVEALSHDPSSPVEGVGEGRGRRYVCGCRPCAS